MCRVYIPETKSFLPVTCKCANSEHVVETFKSPGTTRMCALASATHGLRCFIHLEVESLRVI